MSYGFSSLNTDGLIQIDGNFSNISILSTGIFTQTTFDTYWHLIDEKDLYFIRAGSAGQYISAYTGYNGANLYIALTVYSSVQGENCTVEYLRCRPSHNILTTPPSIGYGLNVIRPDGNLAFSSELITPQITNVISVNTSGLDLNGTVTQTFTLNTVLSGKKRYFAANSFSNMGILYWSPDFGETMYDDGCFISASNINSTQIGIKCSTPWIEGLVFGSERTDSINQLLIVEF